METTRVKNTMDKGNKTSLKGQSKAMCDSCGLNRYHVTKNKNGYNYCKSCNHMQKSAKKYCEPINKEEFDKMLKMALDTPPLEFDWLEKNQKGKEEK